MLILPFKMKTRPIILWTLLVSIVITVLFFKRKSVPIPTGLSAPIEMVEIPPGEFLMGSSESEEGRDDDETQHVVRISYAFKMSKYEITQRQWYEVTGVSFEEQKRKAWKTNSLNLRERLNDYANNLLKDSKCFKMIKWVVMGDKPIYSLGEGEDYPVYFVSYNEAMKYCAQLTEIERAANRLPEGCVYRLPTEVEWEYAARGGAASKGFLYSGSNDLDMVAWFNGNSGNKTHPVGQKKANELGLYDMSGNVEEWCQDYWISDYPSSDLNNPDGLVGASQLMYYGMARICRGGSWLHPENECRVADRYGYRPSSMYSNIGFRIILEQPQSGAIHK